MPMELSQRRAALVRRLHKRKGRSREGAVLVEGVRTVREVLDAGIQPRFAIASTGLDQTEGGAELRRRLEGVVGDVVDVADDKLTGLAGTETPQGVLLVCDEPNDPVEAVLPGPVLLLDAVQDPGNVGTLIRSAVAFGFTGVLVADGSADPWSPKAVRSSTGSSFRIPVVGLHLTEALASLRGASVSIWAADADGVAADTVRAGPDRGQGYCLAVGNEGRGIRSELREAARTIVKVDMRGPVESLNAAVAGSILMHAMTSPGGGPS